MNLKDTIYWQIFSDIWNLMKQFFPVQDSDKYWSELVEAADAIYEKYKGTEQAEFAKEQILTILNELERIHREGGKN